MGIFDKIKEEAEKLTHKDPDAAQQAEQMGQDAMHNRDNLGEDMKAAQDTIKQQGGAQDQGMEGDGMQAQDPNVEQNP
jgi:hypothetical protein